MCVFIQEQTFLLIACRKTVATCQLAAGSESCILGGGSSKGNDDAWPSSCWGSQQVPSSSLGGFHASRLFRILMPNGWRLLEPTVKLQLQEYTLSFPSTLLGPWCLLHQISSKIPKALFDIWTTLNCVLIHKTIFKVDQGTE